MPRKRSQARVYGRIWLRPTDEEWDAILSAAQADGESHTEWVARILVAEATAEKSQGHYLHPSKVKIRRNRRRGDDISNEDLHPKKNIFCAPDEQDLIRGVAAFYGKSVNLWASRILAEAVLNATFRQTRRAQQIIADQHGNLDPKLVAELKAGRIPKAVKEILKLVSGEKKH